MEYSLRFHQAARDDLSRLYQWIADEGGSTRAAAYLARIEAACLRLRSFPLLGRADDDLGPGLRVLGFERRAAIIYRIAESRIDILAIYHGGRDLRALGERP